MTRKVQEERTMTVIAPTEAEAKRKVEAAVPATPADESGSYEAGKPRSVTFERIWLLEGGVEEVQR